MSTKDGPDKPARPDKATGKRAERLAEALRANLKRRKQQARARSARGSAPSGRGTD